MRLAVFLSIFLSVYGLLHAYAFLKMKKALEPGRKTGLGLVGFMVFMVFCPILIRWSEGWAPEAFSRGLAYAGYTWMGLLFIFVCIHAAWDGVGFFAGRFIFRKGTRNKGVSFRRRVLWVCTAASVLAALYGYFDALRIRTEYVTLHTRKLSPSAGKIRIVQISDVHLGLVVRHFRLRKILQKAAAAKPDILVSTGDLVDGQIDDISGMAADFRAVHTPYGKIAVTGNHEYYAGIHRAAAFIQHAGFSLLRGETREVGGVLRVVGVEDPTAQRYPGSKGPSEDALLPASPAGSFVLLLKHRPVLDPKSRGRFDLQLSGHAHKGQIFPFSLIIKALYPIDAGLLPLAGGGHLYVSRGSGTWGPPIRLFAPPEVTVIDLVPEEKKDVEPQ